MDAIAIVVEDGVHPQEAQHRGRLDPALINRKTGSQIQQREGATIVRSSALNFFWRIITRVAEYITRIRRCFVFTLAKNGNLQVKEERAVTRNEIKVEEGPVVQASGACEPLLAEIIVSEKETIASTRAESKTVELLYHDDCGSNCTRQITVEHAGDNPTLSADNHGAACKIECASPSEQATRDSHLQKPANLATCVTGLTFPPELKDGHCTTAGTQLDKCHSQDASREEELRDDVIRNKCLTIEAPSLDSKLETSGTVEESALEQVTRSKSANKKFSIHHLNAIVAEQLSKYLQVLERSMVPATLNQNTTHRRAIILATLVAVAVWARNSKHLHEAMPCIKGSAINVHIRSRL